MHSSLGFEGENASVKELTVNFSYANSNFAATAPAGYYNGKAFELAIDINASLYDDIDSTNPNGVSSKIGGYLDRTIAHELTHSVMEATIDNFYNLPNYFVEGMAELTHGADDTRKTELKQLADDSSKLATVFSNDTYGSSEVYSGGYMLLRYFANQASDSVAPNDGLPIGAYLNGTSLTLDNSFTDSLWLDGWDIFAGQDVYQNSFVTEVDATAIDRYINLAGNNQNNIIKAGSNTSYLWGGWGGDDTLIGGNGWDMFWYGKNEGNDVITNIEKNDYVNLFDVKLSDISGINITDSDILIAFHEGGSLNVQGAAKTGNTFMLGGDNTVWAYSPEYGWYGGNN